MLVGISKKKIMYCVFHSQQTSGVEMDFPISTSTFSLFLHYKSGKGTPRVVELKVI